MRQMRGRACAVAAMVAVTAVTVAGCGGGGQPKTAAGFCRVYEQQKSQYLAKYGRPANGSGLAALTQLAGAVSDLVPMFEALDAAAPPGIEPDVHTILDSFKQQQQNMGQDASNPLAGLASGLMSGLKATSSWENLSAYIAKNCGPEGG